MHFIVASNGSYGDVFPFVAIAHALAARGHDVDLISNEKYAHLAGDVRFTAASSERALDGVIAHFDVARGTSLGALRDLMQGMMVEPLEAFYRAIADKNRPGESILVAFPLTLGARMAHDHLGIPYVSAQLAPSALRSALDPPRANAFPHIRPPAFLMRWLFALMDWGVDRMVLSDVNRFRATLSLPPTRGVFSWMDSPQRILGLFPPWYGAPRPDWAPHVVLTDFPRFGHGALRPETTAFLEAGPPPIVFTAGSPAEGVAGFFRAAVSACEALGRRGILVTRFRGDLPKDLPASVLHTPHTRFDHLLPRSAALVFHGGIGTSADVLQAGIPALVTPWGVDQFDNAMRLQRLGLACELPFNRVTPARLTEALRSLLDDATVAEAARSVAGRFSGVGTGPTCEALERFGREVWADADAQDGASSRAATQPVRS